MDLSALESELATRAGAYLVDPRALRRLIKAHRGGSGLVPHARCYAIGRDHLATLGPRNELGLPAGALPERLVLLARPSSRALGRDRDQLPARLWRDVFHARVHLALEARVAAGELDDARVRQRIDAIGQTEFDEVRATLRHDDLVLPPCGDREVYVEFAALYLELRYFAPSLLVTTFPGIGSYERVDAILATDVEAGPLLDEGRPAAVLRPPAGTSGHSAAPTFSAPAAFAVAEAVGRKPVSDRTHARLLAKATAARDRGNDVRAALLCARAAASESAEQRHAAESAAKAALSHLGERLNAALAPPDGSKDGAVTPSWSSLLVILGDRAAAERALRVSVEARLLFTLQRAALAYEQPRREVDVATWIRSRGKRPLVRDLPATRELRVARYLHDASRRIRHTRVGAADRKLLAKLLDWATERADRNVRTSLRPRLHRVLDQVGLTARSAPERLARDKLVEELLDQVLERGFVSFASLRDAVSRNQLKLPDLSGAGELWRGDPLLAADAALDVEIDGLYRRGEIYLRGLQKLSSLPFGTRVGRALTLYLLLPLGAAFVLLEGVKHIFGPLCVRLGLGPIEPLTLGSLGATAAILFGLLHSAAMRTVAMELVGLVGLVLATLFVRVPRAVLARPLVRRWLALPPVRLAIRRVIVPAATGAGLWLLARLIGVDFWLRLAVSLGAFASVSLLFGSRLGAWLEDLLFDHLAPTWQVVSRQQLPALLRLIGRFFAALMDLLERAMYRIDELLRFRRGESRLWLVPKAIVGLLWGMVAYVVRLYVTLLVEPEVNPLKHFPVVTVAHKLMLPWMGLILHALEAPLRPFGEIVAGTFAGVTAFLLPSISGFFAWELKENYKLYQATRAERLPPARIGPHGETMRGLLVAGLHSGTLPKLYERLRRAAQREDEAALARRALGREGRVGGGLPSLGRFREGLHEIERGIRRFVERELVVLLTGSSRWRFGAIDIAAVELSSNRIRIRLGCPALGQEACELTIEEQSGLLVAGMVEPGFVTELVRQSAEGAVLLENALAGLYQRAEVELVREQIVAEIGEEAHYDIADGCLVVWPDARYRTELSYALRTRRAGITPKASGEPSDVPLRVLDRRKLVFGSDAVGWLVWVAAWSAADHPHAPIARLVPGTSLLPVAPPLSPAATDPSPPAPQPAAGPPDGAATPPAGTPFEEPSPYSRED